MKKNTNFICVIMSIKKYYKKFSLWKYNSKNTFE